MSPSPNVDFEGLIWETRGFLGLDDENPVPLEELKTTAREHGYTEREIQTAVRETDTIERAGGSLDNIHVRFVDSEDVAPDEAPEDDDAEETPRETPPAPGNDVSGTMSDGEYTTPESGVWPPTLLEREQWMGHRAKKPFAPWADPNAPAPCADDDHTNASECGCDARWKWGYHGNYADGETVAMAEDDPRLDGRAFLQTEEDPFAYVDGDDVRCPETGDVHPEFLAILDSLGVTYADVSTSGSGVHALYRGELPEGVKQAAWELDGEPWGANDEDLPSIEIYAGKRVCVMTGEHVPGTPTTIHEWDSDALEEILDENDQLPEETASEYADFDPDQYNPIVTSGGETTHDVRDVFAALGRLDAQRVADRTIVHAWNDNASTSAGNRAFAPTWGRDSNGTANIVDDRIWQDTGDGNGYGGPVIMALIDAGELNPRGVRPSDARGELFWKGVEHLRGLGFDIPKYEPETGNGPPEPEVCDPPAYDPEPFDREEHWNTLQGERFDEYLDTDAPMIWADPAGTGKTTNAGIGADVRGRAHAVFFDQHEKAREYQLDDATPSGYYHLRGGAQKRESACMDADHAGEECPTHGHGSNCPTMCPLYERSEDDPGRILFDALKREIGPVQAHQIVDPHDGEECEWLEQFSEIEHEDHVVAVKQYMTLKTVREGRICIIDEKPGTLASNRRLSVEDLVRAGNRLDHLGGVFSGEKGGNFRAFARFTRAVVDVLTDPTTPDTLDALDAPEIAWGEHMVSDGTGDYGVKKTLHAETLARLKVEYSEHLIGEMKEADEWDRTPLCFDAILLAAIKAGLHADASQKAVAAPLSLSHCPRCSSRTDHHNGARACGECGWHEHHDTILARSAERGRGTAWVATDVDDVPIALRTRITPCVSDLPETPLILDATASPGPVRGLFGANPVVTGDTPVDANMRVTQVTSGQYHFDTIRRSAEDDRGPVAGRIQSVIDTAANVHGKVLAIGKQATQQYFDLPGNVDWLHYHAVRGLNRAEYDAVICVGAPHPDVDDLRRDAEILATDDDGLDAGGIEHSTRADSADAPTRKYVYTDDSGRGREIETKAYTGLTGEMFRENREDELEQCVHRLRPVLAEETKHVYLLTNVPTGLPVDELVGFDELADPLRAMLPVADGALELLGYVRRVLDGEGDVNGFRAETLIDRDGDHVTHNKRGFHRLATICGMDVGYRTVTNWVNDLEAIGLLDAGAYEQRRGRVYSAEISTLNSALSVLHGNGSFKVAAQRRLRAKLADAPRALDWLEWAQDVFGLSGDRCDLLDGGDGPTNGAV